MQHSRFISMDVCNGFIHPWLVQLAQLGTKVAVCDQIVHLFGCLLVDQPGLIDPGYDQVVSSITWVYMYNYCMYVCIYIQMYTHKHPPVKLGYKTNQHIWVWHSTTSTLWWNFTWQLLTSSVQSLSIKQMSFPPTTEAFCPRGLLAQLVACGEQRVRLLPQLQALAA